MKRRGFLGALVGLGAAACGRAGASEAVASVPPTLPTETISGFGMAPIKREGAAVAYDANPLAKGLQEHFGADYAYENIALKYRVRGRYDVDWRKK